MGFATAFSNPEKTLLGDQEYIAAFGEDLCRYWCRADITLINGQLDVLLWASVAKEGRILPKARWLDFFITDLERGVVLHVYDDRGMDVCARDQQALVPLYTNLSEWLLEYDRPAMDAAFAAKA